MRKRIVLWINKEPCQIALACKLSDEFEIAGIVFESRPSKRKITAKKILEKVYERLFLKELNQAWLSMQEWYSTQYSDLPENINTIEVSSINSEHVLKFTENLNPDFVLVSGTSLVKKNMFTETLRNKLLNLHTGLSPYIKGGPNCTNWCFAINQPELIGNTVMWLDEGIDTGKIVTTETTLLNHNMSFADIHKTVMEHAHDLYIRALKAVSTSSDSFGISQSELGKGHTFFNKQWTLDKKIKALNHFKQWKRSPVRKINRVVTIPLPKKS